MRQLSEGTRMLGHIEVAVAIDIVPISCGFAGSEALLVKGDREL